MTTTTTTTIAIVYLILYVAYIILGPHFIARLIKGDTLEIVDSPTTFFSRALFLSYLSYLATAYFFLNPTQTTWIIAIIINISALIGYIVRWFPIRNIDPYYWSGMIAHIIQILPLFIMIYPFFNPFFNPFFKHKTSLDKNITKNLLNNNLLNNNLLTILITIILLILYFIIQNNIYRDEKWKEYI